MLFCLHGNKQLPFPKMSGFELMPDRQSVTYKFDMKATAEPRP